MRGTEGVKQTEKNRQTGNKRRRRVREEKGGSSWPCVFLENQSDRGSVTKREMKKG